MVAIAVFTFRSYWVFDRLDWTAPQSQRSIVLNRARFGFSNDIAVNGSVFGGPLGFKHWRFAAVRRLNTMPERWADSYFECAGCGYLRQVAGATDSRDWWVSTWLLF